MLLGRVATSVEGECLKEGSVGVEIGNAGLLSTEEFVSSKLCFKEYTKLVLFLNSYVHLFLSGSSFGHEEFVEVTVEVIIKGSASLVSFVSGHGVRDIVVAILGTNKSEDGDRLVEDLAINFENRHLSGRDGSLESGPVSEFDTVVLKISLGVGEGHADAFTTSH